MSSLADPPRISLRSYLQGNSLDTLTQDVRDGLLREHKELSPKYLYDTRGSELFDRITALPDYYPTRCERMILNRRAPEIARMTGARELVELGSGSASKTRALLYALAGDGALRRYVPFDCSLSVVERCAGELGELYPELIVEGVVGDFEKHLGHVPSGDRRLIALLGGTLGNLHPPQRHRFLSDVRATMGSSDWFLLGTDLVKDAELLEAAYNDGEGVTAEFNRNVLLVINRELGGDLDPGAFEHRAPFIPEQSWIEMRLVARSEQRVRIPEADLDLTIEAGEHIRTEISTKFTLEALGRELTAAGMQLEAFFTDPAGLFGLTLASPR